MIKLTAHPFYLTIGVNEEVEFRVEPDDGQFFLMPDDVFEWHAAEVTSDRFGMDPVKGGASQKFRFDKPGKYQVGAFMLLKKDDPRRRGKPGDPDQKFFVVAQYFQNVQPGRSFMWDPVNRERTHVQNPASAVEAAWRYLRHLELIGAPLVFDLSPTGVALRARHDKTLKRYREYLDTLRNRLSTTEGDIWIRIPVTAIHRPNGSSEMVELKVFLAHRRDDGAVKRWKLVDWTFPADKNLFGDFDGAESSDDARAASNAIEAWKKGNNYPAGMMVFTVPAGVLKSTPHQEAFSTTGLSTLARIEDFLEKAGIFLALVAFVLAVVPVPGSQFASAALVLGVLSGAAGAGAGALKIQERHGRGVPDESEDVTDALEIASNLLAVAGSAVRMAKVAVRVGTTVKELVFVGEAGAAAIQGVFVAEGAVVEIEQVVGDKTTLTPDEKLKKLLVVFGKAAAGGALVYLNVKGTAADAARMNVPKQPPPRRRPPSQNGERLDGSPQENLDKLKDPKKKIDLTEDPALTENTKSGDKHITTVHGETPRKPTGPHEFPKPPPEGERGMRVGDDQKFAAVAKENDLYIILRKSNKDAVRWMSEKDPNALYKAKPEKLKAKTLDSGEFSGLAAANKNDERMIKLLAGKSPAMTPEALKANPKALTERYVDFLVELDQAGFSVEGADKHFLVFKVENGKKVYFHGDYDLHGVYDRSGQLVNSEGVRGELNDTLGKGDLIQHGAHDEWPDRNNPDIAGSNMGPQPPCTVYLPDGSIQYLETIPEMKQFYLEHGLDWHKAYGKDLGI